MGDYNRFTRELTLQEIPAEAVQAIQKHVELHTLGNILDDVLICVESKAEKIKKGLFSMPGLKGSVGYVIVTKHWLIDSTKADGGSFVVLSARLADVTVTDYKQSPFYAKIPDNGVEVNGSFTDMLERGSKFIGLEDAAVGDTFKSVLIEAVQAAKR